MRLYLRILRYLGPYVAVFLGAVAASILFAAFDAFSMVLLIPFLSVLMTPEAGASSGVGDGMLGRLLDATAGRFVAGASGPQEAVQALILLILAVFAVKNVFDFLKTWLAARVEQGVTRDLRNQVHDHLLELDLVFFGRTRIGQIVSRLTHDVELVRTLFTREFMRGISAAFEVVAVVVLMVAVSPSLTLLSVAVLPGMVVIWGPMLKKLRREDGRVLDQAAEVNARIQETFSGIRLVKGSAAEDYERGRFHALTGRYFRTFLRTERVRALAAPVTEMVAALGTIVILWYGTRLVLVQGDLTGPAFMGFVALSTKLYRPVKYLSRLPAMIQPALVGGRRLFEYLDAPAAIRDRPDALPFPGVEREIVFDRVGFGYREGSPVLEDVSLVVERGTMVAVVGPSGAGKSTLVDLLSRFFEVSSGRILIDGTDIRRFQLRSLRAMMGIVSQETVLFHD
ncbi:MAG: ABC transporter ATP-binding protein, partial [Gammaproteobacteria bacterium]|nr:ABC transporter ATP-binding protein [Gammaproteobacteria bacterium]